MENKDDGIIIPISESPVTESSDNTSIAVTDNSNTTNSVVESHKNLWIPELVQLQQQFISKSQTPTKRECQTVEKGPQYRYRPLASDFNKDLLRKKSKLEHKEYTPNHSKIEAGDCANETWNSNIMQVEPRLRMRECEPMVDTRVARWWRSHPHRHTESLPVTTNPHTLLFHISRTSDCKSYLQEEKRKLQKSSSHSLFKNRADIHAAIASIDDWLGNYQLALDEISKAVELDPTSSTNRWLQAKLKQQCKMIDIQKRRMELISTVSRVFPTTLEVDRICARDLGIDEFIEHFLQQRKPVILLGVVKDMTTSPWTLDYVKSVAGSVKAAVKCAVPLSVEWAKLEQSREIAVGEFIDQVKEGQTSDYLFDWSLPIHCPQLAKVISLPKYFSGNILQRTLPGSLYHDSWPSLFIAPKGAVSSLHIDAFASHFWMALFQGEKRWTFFEAEDAPLLYPQYFHSMDPVFPVDLSSPDVEQWPLLALTKPRQCVLQPGELLFVPAGSPHYVENLSNSVAVSANHVDQTNFKEVCEELRINAWMDPRAADLLQQLEHPQFMQTFENSLEEVQVDKT